MVQDARTHGEDWDGLGLVLGPFIIAGGALWSALHAGLAVWLWRVRRARGPLTSVGTASAAVGLALAWLGIVAPPLGVADFETVVVPTAVSVLVLLTGSLVMTRPGTDRPPAPGRPR